MLTLAALPSDHRPAAGNDPLAPQAVDTSTAAGHTVSLEQQLETVQREIDALRAELNVLRRRDETLNFYMHRLDEELRLAARLQQDFLPRELPQVGPVRFHTLFRPAGYVSGDLYDVARLDDRQVGFYIADAVGHGVPAALLTMFIKQSLVTREGAAGVGPGARVLSPGEALARLNAALIGQNLSQSNFATALYGMIDTQTLKVTLARAGHPPAVLLRADGRVETVQVDGSLLGVFPEEIYPDVTVQLQPRDRLVLFTDGLEVAFSETTPVDTRQWLEELRRRRHLPAEQMVTDLSEHLDRHDGSLQPKDDLTVIVVEVGE